MGKTLEALARVFDIIEVPSDYLELDAKLERYQNFVRRADKHLVPGQIDDVFAERDAKIELLGSFGYHCLKSPGGQTALESCSAERVGNAFKKTYYGALKGIERIKQIKSKYGDN